MCMCEYIYIYIHKHGGCINELSSMIFFPNKQDSKAALTGLFLGLSLEVFYNLGF